MADQQPDVICDGAVGPAAGARMAPKQPLTTLLQPATDPAEPGATPLPVTTDAQLLARIALQMPPHGLPGLFELWASVIARRERTQVCRELVDLFGKSKATPRALALADQAVGALQKQGSGKWYQAKGEITSRLEELAATFAHELAETRRELAAAEKVLAGACPHCGQEHPPPCTCVVCGGKLAVDGGNVPYCPDTCDPTCPECDAVHYPPCHAGT